MDALLIKKIGLAFWHAVDGNTNPDDDFMISDFDININLQKFRFNEDYGCQRDSVLWNNITVQVDGGAVETFSSKQNLIARLIQINYTPFMGLAITGTYTGLTRVIYGGAPITVPLGFFGKVVNLNDINADVTYSTTGTAMTITSGASNGEVLIF